MSKWPVACSACFFLLVAGLSSWAGLGVRQEKSDAQMIKAVPAVQRQIDKVFRTYHAGSADQDSGASRIEAQMNIFREVLKLVKLVKDDRVALARQLIYYQLYPVYARHREDVILLPMIYDLANINMDDDMVAAVLPYMGTTDEKLAREIPRILHDVEDWHRSPYAQSVPDFSPYQSVLARDEDNPPLAFIEYMYTSNPGEAMRTCMSVFWDRQESMQPVLWAEHVVADVLRKQECKFIGPHETTPEAIAELGRLSKHRAWWARLYVAAILRQEPEFRTEDLMKRLRTDSHPLVRKAIREVRQ